MNFNIFFSMIGLKTTGLQFGYFFGLLFCIIFFIRGIKQERLSDKLLSVVMFLLAMLIQDYTFGFAGINFLWEQMDGWPRHFPWLFPASVYFYFLSQTNAHFKFKKRHLLHLLPYTVYVILSLLLLVLDLTPKNGLAHSKIGLLWDIFVYIINYGGILFYFIKSLKIYKHYKVWTENQYSNTYEIELKWLRDFLWFFLIGAVLHILNTIIDLIYNLPFDQDYYWQLFTVLTIVYLGISGLTQNQDKNIDFVDIQMSEPAIEKNVPKEFEYEFKCKLEQFMQNQKPYLDPDLTLRELATKLKTNTTFLSGIINTHFEKNFNDFINEFRVMEFQKAIKELENKNLTLIAIAYDCGFNSKATFNRAVKKLTGKMPSEL